MEYISILFGKYLPFDTGTYIITKSQHHILLVIVYRCTLYYEQWKMAVGQYEIQGKTAAG